MKRIISVLLLFTVFTSLAIGNPGGDKMSEGTIVYEIDLSGAELDAMSANMLKNSTLTIQFKDKNVRTEFDMGIVNTTVIADGDAKNGIMLMNMMGTKWAIPMTAEDMEEQESAKGEYEIEYTDETKEIAGYKCKKAIIKSDLGNSVLYYTDKIQSAQMSTSYTYSELKGFPLQMEMDQQGVKMKMIAKEVKNEKLSKDVFNQEIPDGFESKTWDDLKKLSGQ